MHDRLTAFCVACGLRQAASEGCVRCKKTLSDLVEPASRAEALLAFRAGFAAKQGDALARDVPSVKHAPLAFATGASVVVVGALAMPLLSFNPLLLAALGAASLTGGFAIGSAIRAISPRFLVGKDERWRIDREVRVLAERSLPVTVPSIPQPHAGLIQVSGRIVGTPCPSPFGDEPLLAARIVGEVSGRKFDDAWLAPGELRFDREARLPDERRPLVSVAWIEAEGAMLLPGRLSPDARARLDAYLLLRGLEVTDETPLSLTVVRVGDSVRVRGKPSPRHVSDGYRGQVEVVDVLDAVIELAAAPSVEPMVVPGPFVPPSMDD